MKRVITNATSKARLTLFPGLPWVCSSVCVQYNTEENRERQKPENKTGGGLGMRLRQGRPGNEAKTGGGLGMRLRQGEAWE